LNSTDLTLFILNIEEEYALYFLDTHSYIISKEIHIVSSIGVLRWKYIGEQNVQQIQISF